MTYYDSYSIQGCEDKEICHKLFAVMLACCDAFSLIYYRENEEESFNNNLLGIKEAMKPYEIESKNVTAWPGTITKNYRKDIYNMVIYRIEKDMSNYFELLDFFDSVNTLWDLKYPMYPTDPCFYKNGYVLFASSTHEKWNEIYINELESFPSIIDLESVGIKLISNGKISSTELKYPTEI